MTSSGVRRALFLHKAPWPPGSWSEASAPGHVTPGREPVACLQAPHSAALRGWGALLTPKCCSAWSSHLCLELARRVLAREAAGQGLLWDQLWAPLQWAPQGSWGPAADGGAQKLPRACCWRGAHTASIRRGAVPQGQCTRTPPKPQDKPLLLQPRARPPSPQIAMATARPTLPRRGAGKGGGEKAGGPWPLCASEDTVSRPGPAALEGPPHPHP